MIKLTDLKPFAQGGNRLCFVDPRDPGRCIKVRRPEFTLEDMRRAKGFPHTLFPASRLDESHKEDAIMTECESRLGDRSFIVLSRNYGFVETDMGQGLCSELIRNADGRISLSVMQHVWENGLTPTLQQAVDRFEQAWIPLLIPTRDILLHNVVAQCNEAQDIVRLVVIDGLGHSGMIPFKLQPRFYKLRRAQRKIQKFRRLIEDLLEVRKSGKTLNMFWQQQHDGLS